MTTTRAARLPLLVAPLLALAAGSCSAVKGAAQRLGDLGRPNEPQEPQALAPPTTVADAKRTVLTLEDARSDGGGLLQVLLRWEDVEVRVRAARALGRLSLAEHGEGVTDALVAALADAVPAVRAEAAFALGMRADPAAADALLARFDDRDEGVRARVVEAASKIDHEGLRARALAARDDPAEAVRIEAAIAPHRWPEEGTLAQRADAHLAATTRREGESPEVVWRALFSLQRRRSGAGLTAFLQHARSADVLARLFAVKGLARLPAPPAGTDAAAARRVELERALGDADWRVATEAAAGLGALADARSLEPLGATLDHPSFHVRAATYAALGRLAPDGAAAGARDALLERGRADRSAQVRAAALVAEAGVGGARALPAIEVARDSSDAVVREGAARAAALLDPGYAELLLLALSRDSHVRVASAAVAGLGELESDGARERLLELFYADDEGLRVAAVSALRSRVRPEDLAALEAAWAEAEGELGPDVRVEVARSAGALGGTRAEKLLLTAAEDASPRVRRVALEELERLGRTAPPVPVPARMGPRPEAPPEALLHGPRVFVDIETTRGTLAFELFPREAPFHVHSFLALAERGKYDGLDFHRVVSDFVIQGGCHRGDGNGGGTWRGPTDSLRHEIGPRKYVRGSLGMPRGEEIESGGSQLFVTHRPTPHLDGRYTIFGELREGFDVLDAIEVGDRITAVRVTARGER